MIQCSNNFSTSVAWFPVGASLDTSVCLTNVSGNSGSLDYEEQSRVKECRKFDVARAMKWRSTLLCKICRLYTQRQIRLPIGEG